MAKSCSVSKTVHTFHSMNWPALVFGSNIFDYLQPAPSGYGYFSHDEIIKSVYAEIETDFFVLIKNELANFSVFKFDASYLDVVNTSTVVLSRRFFYKFVEFMFKNRSQTTLLAWSMDKFSPFLQSGGTEGNIEFVFNET